MASSIATTTTGLSITNPLVLYRSLLATNSIRPDPAQHRLAIHLQSLYERLIDYEPAIEYSDRLKQLQTVLSDSERTTTSDDGKPVPTYTRIGRGRSLLSSWMREKSRAESLALTKSLTDHDAALASTAPRGLLLHGNVGTGKSMLVDLFADCLPTKRKRRWHYSTFMLNVVSRLEALRRERLVQRRRSSTGDDSHALLWLARELVTDSPILFLDEFQLPDRMAAKTLSTLFTCFFRLGGVLVATSNRLPDELAKAAGMEYAVPTNMGRKGFLSGMMGGGRNERDRFPGLSEYAAFLELLKGRCEVWDMEGRNDYRRDDDVADEASNMDTSVLDGTGGPSEVVKEKKGVKTRPSKYLLTPLDDTSTDEESINDLISHTLPGSYEWTPATVTVYGRTISIPRTSNGIAVFTFSEICTAQLGPADYITLASTYHTFLITSIPLLTSALKNEARRFITLLDALYEARCKLAISAAAAPDDLFFPDLRPGSAGEEGGGRQGEADDMQAETFSEIHQDLTSPFRPNISSYKDTSAYSSPHEYAYPDDALEDDPPNKLLRAALPAETSEHERMLALGRSRRAGPSTGVNFGRTSGFVGEDETFAWKRAASRLWEMCGSTWWSKEVLWRPLGVEMRHWERSAISVPVAQGGVAGAVVEEVTEPLGEGEGIGKARDVDETVDEPLFRHGASPFRTREDAPPKFSDGHVWGVQEWGKKAGVWGKGVAGLEERKREKSNS